MQTIGVAITVPEPDGSHLQRMRDGFGDPMADMIPAHVTLLPPTVVEDDEYAALCDHLEAVARGHRAFGMVLRGTGTFRPVSPVVFVQVARGIAECERLELAVRSGPVRRDLDFHYHPHVTVAHHVPDAQLDTAFETLADYTATFEVDAIDLYGHGADGNWRSERTFPLGR